LPQGAKYSSYATDQKYFEEKSWNGSKLGSDKLYTELEAEFTASTSLVLMH